MDFQVMIDVHRVFPVVIFPFIVHFLERVVTSYLRLLIFRRLVLQRGDGLPKRNFIRLIYRLVFLQVNQTHGSFRRYGYFQPLLSPDS